MRARTSRTQAIVVYIVASLISLAGLSCHGAKTAADPQNEITEPAPLLNPDGTLAARGWARSALMEYNPEFIRRENLWQKKEWDHYTITTPQFTMAVNIADIFKIVTFASVELIDFQTGKMVSALDILVSSQDILPLTPYNPVHYEHGSNFMSFEFDRDKRTIDFHFDRNIFGPEWDCHVVLAQDPEDENIAVAAPFDDLEHFFYENKILGMRASGEVTVDGRTYNFDPSDSFGVLDWGRGVWPHSNEWHWGVASGYLDGDVIGFNLGDGYSDDSMGTVNVQFAGSKVHKLYYIFFSLSSHIATGH